MGQGAGSIFGQTTWNNDDGLFGRGALQPGAKEKETAADAGRGVSLVEGVQDTATARGAGRVDRGQAESGHRGQENLGLPTERTAHDTGGDRADGRGSEGSKEAYQGGIRRIAAILTATNASKDDESLDSESLGIETQGKRGEIKDYSTIVSSDIVVNTNTLLVEGYLAQESTRMQTNKVHSTPMK